MMIIQKYKTLPIAAKATIWFTLCNFLLKGISFVSGPVFTRLLPEEEYGSVSVFHTYESIILILATWDIQLGAYQKGLYKYKDDVENFTSSSQLLTSTLTVVFFSILGIFHTRFNSFTGFNDILLLILFINVLITPSYSSWLVRCRVEFDYKKAVVATFSLAFLNFVIPAIAVLLIGNSANIKFGTSLVVPTIFGLLIYIRNFRTFSFFKDKSKLKEYVKFDMLFSAPLILHSLSYLVLSSADRIMIQTYVGEKEVAYYSVAYAIANVATIFSTSINQSLIPWIFSKLETKDYKMISKVSSYIIICLAVAIMSFLLLIPEGMKLLFPANYQEAIWCIPPVTSSVFFMFLYSLFVDFEEYYEKTKYVMYVSLFCALFNLVTNYFGIKEFGYIACAYTTWISYILFCIGHFYFYNKVRKKMIGENYPFNTKIIVLTSVIVSIYSIGITVLYEYILLRYILLALVAVAVVLMRRRMFGIIREIRKR